MTSLNKTTTSNLRVLVSVFVATAILMSVSPVGAQSADQYIKVGNSAYNSGKYSEAVAAYVSAIQTEPTGATKTYLNMARAYNQLGQYQESAQYYDWFLQLASEGKNIKKAKAELKRVKKKLRGKKATSILTATQESAIQALESALKDGPFLDADGGGAYGLYSIVLKTGYATPKLAPMKLKLAEGLVKEGVAVIKPETGQPVATLDPEGWRLVRERISKIQSLDPRAIDERLAEGIDAMAQGWVEYSKGSYPDALKLFELSISLGPRLLSAHWGRALATIYEQGVELDEMLSVIDETQAAFIEEGSLVESHFLVLKAIALQSAGKKRDAAMLLHAL